MELMKLNGLELYEYGKSGFAGQGKGGKGKTEW
jgi:hypothetical protein